MQQEKKELRWMHQNQIDKCKNDAHKKHMF